MIKVYINIEKNQDIIFTKKSFEKLIKLPELQSIDIKEGKARLEPVLTDKFK
jgi:hypothetical protein